MLNKKLLSCWVILVFTVAGCAPSGSKYPPDKPYSPIVDSKYIDLSPFSGIPCAAPCWHNITVDESTKEETLVILKSLGFIDQASIKETTSGYWDPSYESHDSVSAKTLLVNCKEPSDTPCLQLDFVNSILKRIIIFPNYTITLLDAVTYFHDPSCLSLHGWGAECLGCGLDLSWDKRQLSVSVLDQRCSDGAKLCSAIGHGGKVPPDYVVDTIVYYSQAWVSSKAQECLPWPGFEETKQ